MVDYADPKEAVKLRLDEAPPADHQELQHPQPESDLPQGQKPSKTSSWSIGSGLLRHRLITAASVVCAMSLFSLSVINPNALIMRNATLDSSMHLHYAAPLPQLPPNVSFVDTTPSEGLYQVVETSWDGDRFGFVDEAGKMVVKPQYLLARDFHLGLAVVGVTAKKSDNFSVASGAIDKQGKIVIEPKYSSLGDFKDGVAVASDQEFYYLLDRHGKVLLKNKHSLENFGGIISTYLDDSTPALINPDGSKVPMKSYTQISLLSGPPTYRSDRDTYISEPTTPMYFTTEKHGKHGVIDTTGKEILPPTYEGIESIKDGVIQVETGEGYAYVTLDQKKLFEVTGTHFTPYGELVAGVVNNRWRVFDKTGKQITTPTIESVLTDSAGIWFSDGMGAVVVNGKCGYIDATGKMVVPPIYDFAMPFQGGYGVVWSGDGWYIINKVGKIVTPKLASIFRWNGGATVAVAGPIYSVTEAKSVTDSHRSFESRLSENKRPRDQ